MEEMIKVVYVDFENERLCSSAVTGAAEVVYIPNEWAVAPKELADRGYHLLVYESLEAALAVTAQGLKDIQIWKCEAEGEVPLPPRKLITDLVNGHFDREPYGEWPGGTRMFERVKLTELIS